LSAAECDREGAKSAKEDAKGRKARKKMEDNFSGFRGRAESGVAEDIEDLAFRLIGAANEVHRILGPDLSESVYHKALWRELTLNGIPHSIEDPFDVRYKGVIVGQGRVDLLVDNKLIVELKTVNILADLHRSQALTYLLIKQLRLALLNNFNVTILRDGVKRVINTR
jgi:GxxExxY protein